MEWNGMELEGSGLSDHDHVPTLDQAKVRVRTLGSSVVVVSWLLAALSRLPLTIADI